MPHPGIITVMGVEQHENRVYVLQLITFSHLNYLQCVIMKKYYGIHQNKMDFHTTCRTCLM